MWKSFWNKTQIHEGRLAQGEPRWQSRGRQYFQVLHSENWTQTENSFLAATGKLQSWAETWTVPETLLLEKWVKGKNASVKKETVSHPTGWEGLAGQETGETQRCSQENWGKSDRQQQGDLIQSDLRAAQTSSTWKEFCVPKIRGISIVSWWETILEGHMKDYSCRKPKFLYFLFPASQTHVSSHCPGNWVPSTSSSVRHLKEAHWKQMQELGRQLSLQSVRQIGGPVFDSHDHKH